MLALRCNDLMEVELTVAGRNWLQEHHSQDIPYRIPPDEDGKPIIRKLRKVVYIR